MSKDYSTSKRLAQISTVMNENLFGSLQNRFLFHLDENLDGEVHVEAAKLAIGVTVGKASPDSYRHFSAVGSLLAINEQLTMKKKATH